MGCSETLFQWSWSKGEGAKLQSVRCRIGTYTMTAAYLHESRNKRPMNYFGDDGSKDLWCADSCADSLIPDPYR